MQSIVFYKSLIIKRIKKYYYPPSLINAYYKTQIKMNKMKNVFRILSLALVASSMFLVSCKKDEENVSKVTFGDKEWNIAKTDGVCYTRYNEIQAGFFADSTNTYPYAYIDAITTRGAYSATFDTAKYKYNDDILSCYYYSAADQLVNVTVNGQSVQYADFWAKNVNYVVDSFDATGATISFRLTADMFDFYKVYTETHMDVDNAATTKMSIVALNQTVKADNRDFGKALPAGKVARPAMAKGADISR